MANQYTKAKEQLKKKTSTKKAVRVEMQSILNNDGMIGAIPAKEAERMQIKSKRNKVPQSAPDREAAAKAELTKALDRIKRKYRVAIEHEFTIGNGRFNHFYIVRGLEY